MKVLVVAAHPDDETLGCGGTIARLAKEGHQVSVAILGIRHLLKEANAVAALLGATEPWTDILPDQRFDSVNILDITQKIEGLIAELGTEVVYTHHPGDLNRDHTIVSEAVLTATRPKPGSTVKEVYLFEVPSSTDWSFGYTFQPNVFMDISATLHLKLDAMELYQGEVHPYPHPRSRAALHAMADRWGSMVGLYHAEAFQLVRSIR